MTLHLSASTLETAACLARYRYYKLLHRKPDTIRSGADAGTAVHRGMRTLMAGASQADQEAAVLAARAKLPMADGDYRHGEYLVNGLSQLRAELAPLLSGWKVLEVEKRGETPLGGVPNSQVHPNWLERLPQTDNLWFNNDGQPGVAVVMQYVRDAVVQRLDNGHVVIIDLKTSSRDDGATVAAFQNSGQFKAYHWTWDAEHLDTPCREVQPLRLIMRAPSKTGVTFTVKLDPAVRFDSTILEEWRRNTMRRALDILSRDPDDEADWPMTENGNGTCRHVFGCCDYLDVCTKPPGDRALKLATNVFRDARVRDHDNEGSE